MVDITRIDLRKVNDRGRYVDLANDTIFDLTDEQILALRRYYNDYTIAKDRDINFNSEKRVEVSTKLRSKGLSSDPLRPNYRMTREKKFDRGSYYKGRKPNRNLASSVIIVGSIIVFVFIGGKLFSFGKGSSKDVDSSIFTSSYEYEYENDSSPVSSSEVAVSTNEFLGKRGIDLTFMTSPVADYLKEQQERLSKSNMGERELLIQDICNVYQVDYDQVYNCLVDLTDNFENEKYINGVIDGVVCKSVPVQANTEEELLIYTVRCMKHFPETFGLSSDTLFVNNGYTSSDDYLAQINKVSDVLGIDRCLMFAIVQSECGFDSNIFNEKNNPAGLRNNGSWWVFDTKEEGFLELGMEILKYYRMIGVSPTNIDYDTISKIRDIHAPLSDGNEHWLPNVMANIEYAKLHEAELFGTFGQSNGLGK